MIAIFPISKIPLNSENERGCPVWAASFILVQDAYGLTTASLAAQTQTRSNMTIMAMVLMFE
jgi:hypothetical protein